MKRVILKVSGLSFVLMGVMIIFASPIAILGHTVLIGALNSPNDFAGGIFFILGLFLFILSHESESSLEGIVKSKSVKKLANTAQIGTLRDYRNLTEILHNTFKFGSNYFNPYSGKVKSEIKKSLYKKKK